MQPQLTLLFCILFILYLFKIDSKRGSGVSHALWIPLIWVMIIGSRFVSQWLNLGAPLETPEDYLEGSHIDRIFFLSLIVVSFLILCKRRINWLHIAQNNGWIFLFLLYCGISILWANYPLVALKRWVKEIGNLLMVLIVLSDPYPVEAVKTIIRKCTYVLIPLSFVFIKYYPALGRSYSPRTGAPFYHGVATDKNSLGMICLISGIFFFWNLLTIWRNKNVSIGKKEIFINLIFLIMILWLLKMANSATSLVCFIIGVYIILVTRMPFFKKNVRYITTYILFAVLIFFILEFSFGITQIVVSNLGREETLTERIPLWNTLIEMDKNPLIGTGYGSFWVGNTIQELREKYSIHINQAHNGYLEIYLNLGLIGLLLFIGIMISAYRNSRNKLISEYDYGCLKIAFIVIALLYNVTEAAFIRLSIIWFIFLLMAVRLPRISKVNYFSNKQ